MASVALLESPAVKESGAYQTLLARAQRKTGSIPAPLLVRHVLSMTRGADWPVQREAMEALLRRFSFGQKDKLEIASRPPAVFGLYATRREGSTSRPYQTLLLNVDPPEGSCDCPDFLRSSLGICKHLLAVLEDALSRPRILKEALMERLPNERSLLRWHPVRALTGPGDWMEQIRWSGREGLRETFADKPRQRLALVQELTARPSEDPALCALLRAEREKLERTIRDAEAAHDALELLRTLKQKLYPYQREGVEKFLARGRLLLADDMGLGKTAQAIAACHALWNAGSVRRGLLIVPAALKPQWLREWGIFTDIPAAVVDGNPADRRKAFESTKRGFLIANYEQLLRDLDVMHAWKPELVVLDEAQRIKNWATKTAMYVKRLQPPYRLVLTGTPMENRLEELASIMDWVDDFALEPKWRLMPWHTVPEGAGARNLDTLRSRLSGSMIRRLRKEVLGQLPDRTDTRVPVEMTPEQAEEHDALNQPIARLVFIGKKRPLTQAEFLRLMSLLTTQRIISNGLGQLRFEETWPEISKLSKPSEAALKGLSSPKLLELRELIQQIVVEQKRKVVVFSQWRRMLKLADWAVGDILKDCGARAVFFTGHEGQKQRTQNIVDLHDAPETCVLFASDAGGVGLNLQRAASACINLELPWNPAVLEQRIGRIHRLGQKRPVDVYNLVTEQGIESRILELVGSKQAFFQGLFDGTCDEVAFERSGSFLSRVERILEPVRVPELNGEEADGAAERQTDAVVAAADESKDAPEKPAEAPPTADQVGKLFTDLKIRPTAEGGLVIEAPPAAASALAALFGGMAKMLQQAAGGK